MTPWARVVAACLAGVAIPAAALAQAVPRRFSEPPPSPRIFSGTVMHLAAELLRPPDIDFRWNAEFGGNADLVDYGHGRVNVLAHYQAVLGREYQRFDPKQGIYTLEGLASWRRGGHEWFAGVHHVSRHLGDRPKDFPIYYHSLMGRYAARRLIRGWRADLHAGGAWVVSRRYLDYRATVDGDVQLARAASGRAQPFARVAAERVWVEPSLTRTARLGWRLEAGVRVTDARARGELYVGVDQRYDAAVLPPVVRRSAFLGLRISSP